MNLSDNAKKIFETLYCFPGETISDTFKRVANEYGSTEEEIEFIYNLLAKGIWRPNSPVFFNAATSHKMFSACHIVGLDDSMDSIYDVLNVSRKIFQFGAGIGIPIGNLREKDAYIYEGNREQPPIGKSSGPLAFMKLFDACGESTKSGGRSRRAAILMSMPVWHPNIVDFIKCKEKDGTLSNMNISVNLTDDFIQAFKDNIPFQLKSPSNGEVINEINARKLWDILIDSAHATADPGVLFIDTINKYNLLKKKILVETPNPCGEIPLIPWSICSLSSINVHKFYQDGSYDFENLYKTAYKIAKMMDHTLDIMDYPDLRFKEISRKYRHIGLGMMGLADCFFEMNIPYDSAEGRTLAGKIMKTINTAVIEASADLAKENGPFFDYETFADDVYDIISLWVDDKKILDKVKKHGVRNAGYTTIAPTGTVALSCDCSYGMEPCFGLVFTKTIVETGEKINVVNPVFQRKFEKESWYTSDILEKIAANHGSLKGLRGIPKEVRDVFVIAHDIKYKDRVDMQAELQKYVSMAISSTLNLPAETTRDDVSEIYKYAYQKGLKGVTIYRDGSKKSQPISFSKEKMQVQSNFERPTSMPATVHTVETGNGKMYVTVSTHNGKPMEIFISMGKSGGLFNNFAEALGRTISIALQHGVPIDVIVKTLIGINSDRIAWTRLHESDKKPDQILSMPDGIAKLLQRFYSNGHGITREHNGELCTKCGTYSVIMIEGCATCSNCSESRCG